jgi:hypothetical protein
MLPDAPQRALPRRAFILAIAAIITVGSLAVWNLAGRGRGSPTAPLDDGGIVQTVGAGDLDIVLRSPDGALRQGRNTFTIEFRRQDNGTLVDDGTVRASANMTMPGMVMSSGLEVKPSGVPGRYIATAEFGMAGAWHMAIEWNGPGGRGSVTFQGSVQ